MQKKEYDGEEVLVEDGIGRPLPLRFLDSRDLFNLGHDLGQVPSLPLFGMYQFSHRHRYVGNAISQLFDKIFEYQAVRKIVFQVFNLEKNANNFRSRI